MPVYTAPSDSLQNVNANALGSEYASAYGHDTNKLIQKFTNQVIFDAQPRQFFDLAALNFKPPKNYGTDEFHYQEMGYQRSPLVATGTASAVTYPTTHSFTISSTNDVSLDLIIVYPTNEKGVVFDVNKTTNTISVRPQTGGTLPAVVVADTFGNLAPIEADGKEGFSNYFRADTTERYNYVQGFSKVMRFGRRELDKYERMGTTSNYLAMNRRAMFAQERTDLSNIFWNGKRGEFKLAGGEVAKSAGGIYETMIAAGSPGTTATTATLVDAFEDIVMSTEYGEYGDTRFAYMDNRLQLILSKAYKESGTRYTPNDMVARLGLKEVDIGSSKVVLIPYHRFASEASFPSSFANMIFVVDHKNINVVQQFAERSGKTLDRSGGIPKNYTEVWLDVDFSLEFPNPQSCGYVYKP